jgi:ADP-heptose:LPS heptosyltransferase
MSDGQPRNILVIKLGALGDFAQAFGPFQAIRRHHGGDRITLLTTAPYLELAMQLPWFNAVAVDARPKAFDLKGWRALRRMLRDGRFDRVYDLQTSDRSSGYRKLFLPGPMPEWSGIAKGCSHPHRNPRRDFMHTVERQAEQLADAGIADVPPPDLGWLQDRLDGFDLPERFALIAPGGAAHRPAKRWPAEHFAALTMRLDQLGITSLLIGSGEEAALHSEIMAAGKATSLAGRTAFDQIISLGRRATLAIGNDTGPMHLLAMAGCPTLVLFSGESDPALCAPRGDRVEVLRRGDLAELSVEEVKAEVDGLL